MYSGGGLCSHCLFVKLIVRVKEGYPVAWVGEKPLHPDILPVP
jgi:hypothetical protein